MTTGTSDPSENSFLQWFTELEHDNSFEHSERTFRLFEKGDQFAVYGKDAHRAASIVYNTTTVVKLIRGSLAIVALSKPNAVMLMKKALFDLQSTVEVYSPEPRKNNSWIITRKASPGNLLQIEDLIFADDVINTCPVVMTVKVTQALDQMTVGVAFCDASSEFQIKVSQFIDNAAFSNLESLVAQISAKECVICDDSESGLLVKKVMERCNVLVTIRTKEFNNKNIKQDLSRLLNHELSSDLESLPVAMTSTAALISYLDLLSDEANFGMFELSMHRLSEYMRLDASVTLALNVFPSAATDAQSQRQMSLFGLLNKCKTSQGSRLLSIWLKQPLLNQSEIEKRLDIVECFVGNSTMRDFLLNKCLSLFPDLHRLAKKFKRGKANLQDVVRIYQVLTTLPHFQESFEMCDEAHKQVIEQVYGIKLDSLVKQLDKLRVMVETTIDLDSLDAHEFRIKPEFDEQLKETKESIDATLQEIQREAQQVAADLNLELDKKLKFEKSPIYGHYLRLSRVDAAAKIRNNSQYIELTTQKSGVFFATAKMRQLSSEFNDLSDAYSSQQQSLVKEIISITATYFPVLESLNQFVAHLDVMLAFAVASISAPESFVRPCFNDNERSLNLVNSRHPCLEVQSDKAFIANDIQMNTGIHLNLLLTIDTSAFHLITGPNMGGKSTFIRQVGLIALMAQVGCFVPCESAELCLFDAILARVGAGDCQVKGISTFMFEMLETAHILKCATPKSLIIIDELGRGTSTSDGFGLAWAIADHIAKNISCFTLFATHFHELTIMETLIPHVKNRQVLVHCADQEMTLLYKLSDGACDESFGIHVAEMAEFPRPVIQLAKRKVEEIEAATKSNKHHKGWDVSVADQEVTHPIHTLLIYYETGLELVNEFMQEFQRLGPESLHDLKIEYKEKMESNVFTQKVIKWF